MVGREDRIRTCDILLPKQARYQTAPLPDAEMKYSALLSFPLVDKHFALRF